MKNNVYIDIASRQTNCAGERICGDTFLSRQLSSNRTIVVVSDGMGHGVKANILSTLTATMLLNFVSVDEDIRKIGEMILKTLPVCSVRKISYSTFTFLDIDHESGYVTIVEHDNPSTMVFRGEEVLDVEWKRIVINEKSSYMQAIKTTRFKANVGDRMVIMSDGVTQSGLGSVVSPFGWGAQNVREYIRGVLQRDIDVSPHTLASKVMSVALQNDHRQPKDDISCAVLQVRLPRRLLVVSCPPSTREHYKELSAIVSGFDGHKAVCGYPVAEIIASEMDVEIEKKDYSPDPDLPPLWYIEGIDLVTEGLATLSKTYDILDNYDTLPDGEGPALELARLLIGNDEINIVMGTKRNVDKNIYTADEFELRRMVIKRLGVLLESKFMKQVNLSYI